MPLTNSVLSCSAIPSGVAAGPSASQGWVHSTETFGTVDGPGIRYVLFLSGCPLRCQYCHNPDSWHRQDGKLTTVAEILTDIAAYRSFFRVSGGITLSGGEPLVQAKFSKSILQGCKAMGLHTALDTSGYLGGLADEELLANVDLVLLDIKAVSGRTYRSLTGVDMNPTIQFAETLAELNKPVWLRYVLVPGLTDQLDEIASLATFAATLGNVERVDVLPFHKLGEHKWRDRGLDYQLEGVQPPSTELLAEVHGIFHAAGLLVH